MSAWLFELGGQFAAGSVLLFVVDVERGPEKYWRVYMFGVPFWRPENEITGHVGFPKCGDPHWRSL